MDGTVSKRTSRVFIFSGAQNTHCLEITVYEVLDPSYGMYVWPSAPVLAQFVWFYRERVKGKRILEIGAGTALPGMLAAKCGGQVTLSDSQQFPHCIENCKKSCIANGIPNVQVISLTWGEFDDTLLNLSPVDIILGSDCFYDSKDFEDIIMTVSFILRENKDAEFWCSYQERSSKRTIDVLLLKWGLVCQNVDLKSFEADSSSLCGSNLPGDHTIQMLIIKLNTPQQNPPT